MAPVASRLALPPLEWHARSPQCAQRPPGEGPGRCFMLFRHSTGKSTGKNKRYGDLNGI